MNSHGATQSPFSQLNIAVLTVSDTRTEESDDSGKSLVEFLTGANHRLAQKTIVKDDIFQIRAAVSVWIAQADVQVVLITGGTGFTSRDVTPQAILPLLDKSIDGFGELFRHVSFQQIGTSTIQSRALAGLTNRTLVVAMPGSPSACYTAWHDILSRQLDHSHRPCNFVEHLLSIEPETNQVGRLNSCESRA